MEKQTSQADIEQYASHQEFRCLPEGEAAQFLGCSRALLRKWRRVGGGPPFLRLGQRLVRYKLSDLQLWINARQGDTVR